MVSVMPKPKWVSKFRFQTKLSRNFTEIQKDEKGKKEYKINPNLLIKSSFGYVYNPKMWFRVNSGRQAVKNLKWHIEASRGLPNKWRIVDEKVLNKSDQ